MSRLAAACVCVLTLSICSAHAQVIVFGQDFESGLGGQESVAGSFVINNTGFGNNGTQMMGHAVTYASDEYSFYQISNLVLPSSDSIIMTFDYVGDLETHFDRFNVQISTSALDPPNDTFFPTATSNMQFVDHDHEHHPLLGIFVYDSDLDSGGPVGVAEFDLTSLAGQTVNIRFQFGSDESVEFEGFNMDNLAITAASAVPEPTTLLLLVALAGVGIFRGRSYLRSGGQSGRAESSCEVEARVDVSTP